MKSIKIILAIERALCTNLCNVKNAGVNSVRIPEEIDWEDIPIKVPASMTIADKDEDKNTIYVVTVKFSTCEDIEDRKHYAYRVRLSDGRFRLIGGCSRPYTMLTVQENMPDSIKDNQLNDVTITYTSSANIPYIVD